ncbi:MAG: C40 family peptidase, partial [Candidatus Sumerlaeia bacterium]|nr:C40 family peptidase [Candidatus Sumerlaeia bacterium]
NDQPLERAFADILREEIQKMVPWNEEFSHFQVDHPLASGTDLPSAVVEYGFLSNAEFDEWVSQPMNLRIEARATYNAVVRMWEENREALEELRDQLLPTDDEADAPSAESVYSMGRPHPAIWNLEEPASTRRDLQFVVNTWRHALITDRNTQYVDASVVEDGDGWFRATGWAIHPHLAEGVSLHLTRSASREVPNDIRMLPDLPEGMEPFAIVEIPMALTWGQPREGAGVQTQLLYGEPLFLLRQSDDGDYFLVMGIDGYTGWVRRDAVGHVTREEFTNWLTGPSARVVKNTMKDAFRIPPASRVGVEDAGGSTVKVRLANGTLWEMPRESLYLHDETIPGETVARTALNEFLYTPYVFGGRSSEGLDCSGLVGAAWAAAGAQLPRDAHQQALVGQITATPWYLDGMLPGDNLFFIDRSGRVIHTGISLGGLDFIHASPPEVHINSLDPESPHYSETWARAFVIARRPMP